MEIHDARLKRRRKIAVVGTGDDRAGVGARGPAHSERAAEDVNHAVLGGLNVPAVGPDLKHATMHVDDGIFKGLDVLVEAAAIDRHERGAAGLDVVVEQQGIDDHA